MSGYLAHPRFTIPIPPSNNTYKVFYCTGQENTDGVHIVRARLTRRAEQFKADAGWMAKQAGVREYEGEVRIIIHAYQIKHGRPVDVDNLPKTVFDAMEHIAYADDTQVADYRVTRHWVTKKPHLELQIICLPDNWREIESGEGQAYGVPSAGAIPANQREPGGAGRDNIEGRQQRDIRNPARSRQRQPHPDMQDKRG